eukprot:scaffold263636_cov45-Prasinocladus_malaysianus.AAC.1
MTTESHYSIRYGACSGKIRWWWYHRGWAAEWQAAGRNGFMSSEETDADNTNKRARHSFNFQAGASSTNCFLNRADCRLPPLYTYSYFPARSASRASAEYS